MKIVSLLVLILAACNKPTTGGENTSPNRTSSVVNIYPHSEEFKKTLMHGRVYSADKSTCLQCHGNDLKGGTAHVSCTKCHSSYPHPSKWALPEVHGKGFLTLADEKKPECLKCHTANEKRMDVVTCTACHKAYPHTGEFKSGDHVAIAGQYQGHCTSCHTDFKRNMPTMESCNTCHEGSLKIQWLKEKGDGKGAVLFNKNQTSQSSSLPTSPSPVQK